MRERIKAHLRDARRHNQQHVAIAAIKKAQREVMHMGDGNLDHPALEHLEMAEQKVWAYR